MADDSGTSPGDEVILEPTAVVRTPRRRALWGALAVVAVAAGTLVASSVRGNDSPPPALPVALGASGSGGAADAAAPTSAELRAAWITYVAGDGLPALGGEGMAYRLDGAVDAARVRALADALGLAGDPTHATGTWALRDGDAVLEVYEDGGGYWWYSIDQPVADSATSSGGGTAGCEPGPAVDCAVLDVPAAESPTTTVAEAEGGAGGSTAACEPGPAVDCAVEPPIAEDPPDSGGGCSGDSAPCATPMPAPAPAECPPDQPCTEPGVSCSPDGVCTAPAECPPGSDCVAPDPMPPECAPDVDCTPPVPVEPPPPTDLPSEEQARAIALDLLAATGMDLDGAKVTVDGPYDAWYVTVEPVLDGLPVSGTAASVSVGPRGIVTTASGSLATPERLGDYALLDTGAAIDRLNEQQGWFGYAPMGRAEVSGGDDPAGTASAGSGSCTVQTDGQEVCETTAVSEEAVPPPVTCLDPVPPVGDEGPTDAVLPAPACVEPYPDPEPVEVVLTGAERVLLLVPSVDGSGTYLVPGYRLSADDGSVVEVVAVVDDSLAATTAP
jgi:hypothetical protein